MTLTKDIRPYQVLVVDDLEHERIAVMSAIRQVIPKCDFVEAKNATEAERILNEYVVPFDLAVIDIKLEELDKDGLTLLKKLRHLHLRTIMVTAYPGGIKAVREAYDAGADSYIGKLEPDYTETLQGKFRDLIEQSRLRESLRIQHAALHQAEQDLVSNRTEWVQRYSGQFILVFDHKVVKRAANPHELWDLLETYPVEERCQMAVIEVPYK